MSPPKRKGRKRSGPGRKKKAALLRELLGETMRQHDQQPEEALEKATIALPIASELEDKQALFELAVSTGRIFARQGKFREAEAKLMEALHLSSSIELDDKKACQLYLSLGAVHFYLQRNEEAMDSYLKALSCDVHHYKVDIYINIANIYHVNGNYERSLDFLNMGLEIAEDQNSSAKMVYCLSNMGANYLELGNYKKALKRSKKAIRILDGDSDNNYMRCNCLLNLGEAYRFLNKPEKASSALKMSASIAGKSGLNLELATSWLYLARLKADMGEKSGALYYLYRCVKISSAENLDRIRVKALVDLQNHFESTEDYRKAYRYLVEIIALRSRMDHEKDRAQLGGLLKNKEKEISILEEQKEEIERQKFTLQKVNNQLEQSVRELHQYAFIVAHDLREPLRSISGFTGLIKHRYLDQLDDAAVEYMDYITGSVQQMNLLLTELLRYSTIETSVKQREKINIGGVVREVLEKLRLLAEERNAKISVDPMPVLEVQHSHIYQLFYHLIENALRFNDAGKGRVSIHCEKKNDGLHHFRVVDNGIGIDPEYHDKIFKIFNRLDKEKYSGTGIGLAICKKIVRLYDGQIWLESDYGSGSTFHFSLRA